MKEIQLIGEHSYAHMFVDDDIYEQMIAIGSWTGERRGDTIFYARHVAQPKTISGKRVMSCFRAHRYAGVFYGILHSLNDSLYIDHINHNGLDNRRNNLRAVTQRENTLNRIKSIGCSSSFRGVHWAEFKQKKWICCKRWRATIMVNGRQLHLGYFENEKDAAIVWDDMARKLGYLESSLNFPISAMPT